jgi:SAM-dependent methyltransferase
MMKVMAHNSVLRTSSEVKDAVNSLYSMGLFPHHGRSKSWDTYKMISIINSSDRSSYILDAGCNGSPILPMLKRLGFKNLYGCDLILKTKYPVRLMKLVCSFYKKEYGPIIEMYEDKALNLSIQNLEETSFEDNTFDYITSLSVIEHGLNLRRYFKEMSRILKKGGMLLTSTDYWPVKIVNKTSTKHNSKNSPDSVFSKEEIEKEVINIAGQNSFTLTEPINFEHKDKVIHWKATGLEYTFIFFALRKL